MNKKLMRKLFTFLALGLAFSACTSAQPPTPTQIEEFSVEQVTLFYDGQIVFYATNPFLENGTSVQWYTPDEAAHLIDEARRRNDHEKVNDLPFTIEGITDPLALAHYYGYASACLDAPAIFENRNNGEKRFTIMECGDLTAQVVRNKYYEQSLTPAP